MTLKDILKRQRRMLSKIVLKTEKLSYLILQTSRDDFVKIRKILAALIWDLTEYILGISRQKKGRFMQIWYNLNRNISNLFDKMLTPGNLWW